MYTPGRRGRIVAHKQETSNELNQILKTLYESAWGYFKEIEQEPGYFMPVPTGDTVYGYNFGGIKSSIRFDTASGKGVGQAERNDELYLTEYSDWERAADTFAGLIGSQPPGNPDNRITIDFNAHGTGSDAYTKWTNANKAHDDPEWNGFYSFFAGVLDLPEYYTAQFLQEREQALGRLFASVYPRTADEMWVQGNLCVHNAGDVERCRVDRYLCEYLSAAQIQALDVLHGVDTATGKADGDWQTCVTLAWHDNRWQEVCEPLRMRVPEDMFGERVDQQVRKYGGVCVVERNVGSAVITRLRELGTPGLYRHKQRDKSGHHRREIGLPVGYANKRQQIAQLDRMFREGAVGLKTPELIRECVEVEWKETQDGNEARGLAGNPDREGAHDDLWDALRIAFEGINYDIGPGYA